MKMLKILINFVCKILKVLTLIFNSHLSKVQLNNICLKKINLLKKMNKKNLKIKKNGFLIRYLQINGLMNPKKINKWNKCQRQ